MIRFILGIILLAVPFAALFKIDDKKKGFLHTFFYEFLFLALLSILGQVFGLFYYWPIILCISLADVVVMFFIVKNKQSFNTPDLKMIDWVMLAVIIISCLFLYQVHYNYTGKINLATDQTVTYHDEKDMKYVYPYFSDEWYSVLLIQKSIANHSLPVLNFDNSFFLDLELFFHSFLATIFLVLGLDPLMYYTMMTVFFNVVIILLVYIFLRINKVSKLSSSLAALSALYITSAANLPGIWNLIPVNFGVILSLLGLCFLSVESLLFAFLTLILLGLFYPPLFMFLAIAVLIFWFKKYWVENRKVLHVCGAIFTIIVLAAPVLYIIVALSPLNGLLSYMVDKLVYVSFLGKNYPQFSPFYIIPLHIIVFAALGLFTILKNKKWLLGLFLSLVFFWFLYAVSYYRLLVEFERVIFLASIVTLLVAGFGLDKVVEYIKSKNSGRMIKYAQIIVLILFVAMMPLYTKGERWMNLTLASGYDASVFYPKAPANNYLVADDLRIFEGIKEKKFLSLPWKGTVIGVATGNYPVVTKEGTISNGSESDAYSFIYSECSDKSEIAKKYDVDYVYIYEFTCPGFEKISQSSEGFVLYKVQ